MRSEKNILNRAIGKILDPLVRLMLHQEISHSEFSELARRSYVKMAFKYFTIPGRKKSSSRVSVITGLSRPEVVRLLKQQDNQDNTAPITKGPLNRATRVIGGWLQDSDFIDEKKQARVLALRGETRGFDELVARYSGGITARAILDELVRVGAVTVTNKAQVKLNHEGYVPSNSETEIVEMVAKHTGDMLSTVVHNVSHEPDERYFQRQVSYSDIPEDIDDEFKRLCHDKSLAMILELNQWLAEKKKKLPADSKETKSRVGLGIYYFNNKNENNGEKT